MTDQDTTQQLPAADPPDTNRPRRLIRSRSDRMLGGVAGGLGDYFRVDPVIFRIGFAVTLLFGGLGFFAYLALWIFVPTEDAARSGRAVPRSPGRVLLAIVVAIAGLFGLMLLAAVAAWAGATGHGVSIALTVMAIGAMLVVAAFRGGARWLILPALALALPLGTVAAADIEFEGGIGETHHRPVSVKAIPDEGYEHGIGEMTIDLRELEWTDGTVVDLQADQGIGRMLIAVPENVCVDSDADAKYGVVEVAGVESSSSLPSGYKATPRLYLDAHIDAGKIEVVNDDEADLQHDRFDRQDDIARSELQERMALACASPDEREGG
jgi:phage shock protein PspC (stress-responsive transcriptional regulator)/predicted membrane protein